MDKKEQPTDDNRTTTWPPEPHVPEVPRTHWQTWSYLTGYDAGDFILGLVAGAVAHLVLCFSLAGLAGMIVSTRPIPSFIFYGSWGFAVAAALFLLCRFSGLYPTLMCTFAIGTVPVAAFNLFILWLGTGIAGGATN